MNDAIRTFFKKLRENGASDMIAKPTSHDPGARRTGKQAEDEATNADSARPRSMGLSDEATRAFMKRYYAGEATEQEIADAATTFIPERDPGSLPIGPMLSAQDRADVAGIRDERKPIKRGAEAALRAFDRKFREVSGVSSGVCHDESDSRRGTRSDYPVNDGDPEDPTRPGYTGGAPDDEPNLGRKAQYNQDKAAFKRYFAEAPCPKCGAKGRLPHPIKKGADPKPLKTACGECEAEFMVAPPKGHGFDTSQAKEASALRHFITRYVTGRNPDDMSTTPLAAFKRSIRDSKRGGMPE